MRKISLLAAMVVVLSFTVYGCQEREEVTERGITDTQPVKPLQETQGALRETNQDIVENKAEFKQEIETKLNTLERNIDQLEAKAGEVATESRDEFNQMLNDLNDKKAQANAKLEQLESASAEVWEDAKSGVTAAVNDLQSTYNQMASRFQ